MIQYFSPDSLRLDGKIRQIFEEGRESFQNLNNNVATTKSDPETHTTGELFMFWWQIFMASLLCVFFVSCISHFAQYYQMTVDQDDSNKLRKRLPSNVRLDILSPGTGRLKLPPPTTSISDICKDAQPKLAKDKDVKISETDNKKRE
jgi:hypothetical protein